MNRPTLKASDVEALAYIYSPEAKSPPAEHADWWLRSIRGRSVMVVATGALVILATIVWHVLRL